MRNVSGLQLSKGEAQGCVIGPFAYNMHFNDLIVTLEDLCEIFNLTMLMTILSRVTV